MVRANDLRRDGWLSALGSVALLATTLLPWLRSDRGDITSWDIVADMEVFGFLDGWGGESMAMVWYAIPALVVVTVLTQMIGRWALSGLLALLTGVIAVLGSAVVLRADNYEILSGGFLTLVCGAVVIVLGARVDLFRTDVNRLQPW